MEIGQCKWHTVGLLPYIHKSRWYERFQNHQDNKNRSHFNWTQSWKHIQFCGEGSVCLFTHKRNAHAPFWNFIFHQVEPSFAILILGFSHFPSRFINRKANVPLACEASVSVLFRSKGRAKNGASKRGGRGKERKETLADKPRDFENHPHRLWCLSGRTDIWSCQQLS